ncbi:1,4-dihydroxy-2-naphthoate octaprenyltransferase [Candidatus Acetothermia bacterium]|jgi:1,4-dihydroxy-2-naphthoate octaprenyltransferase|nr:1,4-dihydroxy-2-naphthoate octaprenyltransferase [Candidatus Acetothermia bacterium]MCI2432196.1 1,4-dihydroxy-2-naphthoate octaprenyltransferase [Candidatus Acetothermia bacterium]MCI2436099.1 1,4-dihydroxy-2-naphthoate octaprenyltransferase [Candidatus Acetothermia bacterium]
MNPQIWFLATRPWSFSMTAISVGVGGALAALHKTFDLWLFLVTLLGAIAVHAATNLINDYFDYKRGVDRPGAPTTLYRPHPLVQGLIAPNAVLKVSLGLYLLAALAAFYLLWVTGPVLLGFILVGLLASFFYTADPVRYKYIALGELSVFLMWGPLMIGGAYFVQTGELSLQAVAISIPFGVLVALVLLANNLRDIEYDGSVGIKTLGTLLGEANTMRLYQILAVLAYLAVVVLVVLRILSPWGLLVFLSAPLALNLIKTLQREIPKDADARTAQIDTLFGIFLILSLILEKLLPLL